MEPATAYAICEQLAAALQSGALSPDAATAAEVAIQAVQTAFGVDLANPAHRNAWSLRRRNTSLANLVNLALSVAGSAGIPPAAVAAASETLAAAPAAAAPEAGPSFKATPDAAVKAEAEKFKAAGNIEMRDKQYTAAIHSYTRAIELDPTVAVYFCNRAAAYLCLRDNAAAAADCEEAVKLDPNYGKAYSRLGMARLGLDDYAGAVEAYRKALALEPDNERTKQELAKAEERLAATLGDRAAAAPTTTTTNNPAAGSAGAGPRTSAGFGGGAGGMPDLSSILSNPAMMQAASQLMSSGALNDLLQNPMMQQMASSMMGGGGGGMPDLGAMANMARNLAVTNPDLVNRIRSATGGAGTPPDATEDHPAE